MKTLLAASILANAALLGALAWRPALAPPAFRDFFTSTAARAAQASGERQAQQARAAARTKAAVARAAAEFAHLWTSLRSDDLATLVARLRAAGFPPAVIRDVIRSEVNARYWDRIAALMDPDPNTPYWRTPPSPYAFNSKRYEEVMQVERERAKVLRDLLADDFFSTGDVTAAQRRQFGNLSRQKIDAVQRIEDDYNEMMAQVRAAGNGVTLPEDREKLALLAREKQADLAAVLTPEELADYTMRSSGITYMLRSQLAAFDPSESEFRAIFQMQQALNDRFPANASGGGVFLADNSYEGRQAAQKELEAQLKAALGDARYADYLRDTNREFQQLTRLAQRDNLPADAATRAFAVRDQVAQQSNRIFDDGTLSADQKRAALQSLAQSTRAQLLAMLGPNAGPAYAKLADQWLTNVERGSAVNFNGPGGMTSISFNNGVPAMVSIGGGAPSYRRLPGATPPPRP